VKKGKKPTLPSAPAKQQLERRYIWNDARSPEQADFFTIGYTGRKIEGIVDLLLQHNVRTLIDIRYNPVSMYRPEVSKSNLQRTVEAHGIEYIHNRALGVPAEIREKAAVANTRDLIWKWYDEEVLPVYPGRNLDHFFNAHEHPVALMCVEVDPGECHRHRLFMALEQMGLIGFDL
jgi:uncharacterized protein (DUF488 family)